MSQTDLLSALSTALLRRADAAVAPINWCEADFVVTPLVAEAWNAGSSLTFVVAGASMLASARALRLPPALTAAGPLTMLTGLASCFFHATLTLAGQRADEVFENLALVALLHGASPSSSSSSAQEVPGRALAHGAAAAAGILLVSAFLFTELHLIGTAALTGSRLAHLAQRLPAGAARSVVGARVRLAALAGALGAACWLADRLFCEAVGPAQLHAWWHLLGAVCLHEAAACAGIAHIVLVIGAPPPPASLVPLGTVFADASNKAAPAGKGAE